MKKKISLRSCILAVLLLLCSVSLVTCVTLSRYTGTAMSGNVGTVAAVAGSVNSTQFDISGISPSEIKTIQFTVNNVENGKTSEVSLDYTVNVTSTGNLPLSFNLAPSGGGVTAGDALIRQGSANSWTGGTLAHSTAETDTYTLTVTWASGSNSPDYADEIDQLTINVAAVQKD